MRYDEDANHKLFWAIAVALVGVTCMIIASGCSTLVLCKSYDPTVSGKYGVCEVVRTK